MSKEDKNKLWGYYLKRCKELNVDWDLFDFQHEIGEDLNYAEGITQLEEKVFSKYEFKENFTKAQQKSEIQKQVNLIEEQGKNTVLKWIDASVRKSKIYAIIGGRGFGKSCLGFALLEWHKELVNRKCYAYKFPKPSVLPEWISTIEDVRKARAGGVVLIDESGIEFNQFSFNSSKSVELANILKTARHKDLSIIFIAQNGANLTRDIRRLVDSYLLKAPSFTQLYDEISIIKKMYQNCFMLFGEEEQKKGFYIMELGQMSYFDLPSFWNDEISKAYDGDKEETTINKLIGLLKTRK